MLSSQFTRRFTVHGSWLTRRLTAEEIESLSCFGQRYETDEVWEFAAPPWATNGGQVGLVLIRDGKIINHVVVKDYGEREKEHIRHKEAMAWNYKLANLVLHPGLVICSILLASNRFVPLDDLVYRVVLILMPMLVGAIIGVNVMWWVNRE